jgi:DNA topoisomerase VI subunit A
MDDYVSCASPKSDGFFSDDSSFSDLSDSWHSVAPDSSSGDFDFAAVPVPGPAAAAAPAPAPLAALDALVLRLIERVCAREDATLAWPGGAAPLFSRSAASGGAFAGARAFAGSLRALVTASALLREGKTATCRELYYMHAAFFSDAVESAGAVARVQGALGGGAPRHALGLLAASRGWVAGALTVDGASLLARAPRGAPIGAEAADARGSAPRLAAAGARFILVVEKEALFRRLVEDRVWEARGARCVLLTGCGQPDLATRAFLRACADAHGARVPVLGLADCNPFGLAILLTYARGSAARPEAAASAVPALRWLALRTSDVEALALPRGARQRTTRADDARARALAATPAVRFGCAALRAQVDAWIGAPREKVELEGVLALGLDFFTRVFLRKKLGLDDGADGADGRGHAGPLDEARIDALRLDADAPPEQRAAPLKRKYRRRYAAAAEDRE